MAWSRRLDRVVLTRRPKRIELRTLADARAFTLALPVRYSSRRHWQKAAELMLAASGARGDVAAATDQLVLALLLDGMLDPTTAVAP